MKCKYRNRDLFCFYGYERSLEQWAKAMKIKPDTIRSRIDDGWNEEEAFTTPNKNKLGKKSEWEYLECVLNRFHKEDLEYIKFMEELDRQLEIEEAIKNGTYDPDTFMTNAEKIREMEIYNAEIAPYSDEPEFIYLKDEYYW